MKTEKSKIHKTTGMWVVFFLLLAPVTIWAQENNKNHVDLNIGWQFNKPLDNDYVSKASGWGMNVEADYKMTARLAVGTFVNWHTNREYFPRETFTSGTQSVTLDKIRSIFQVPFGVSGKYYLLPGTFMPYLGVKLGANYSKIYSDNIVYFYYDNPWGFYVSPEIGCSVHPFRTKTLGFRMAGYYTYATNESKPFNIDKLSNWGFRLGIAVSL